MTAFQFDPEIVPDADRVVERYRAWWNNECLDRPLVFLDCNLEKPTRPLLPIRDYSKDFLARQTDAEYRIAYIENRLSSKRWFGDAIPSVGAGMNISYTALLAGATIHYDGMDWIRRA